MGCVCVCFSLVLKFSVTIRLSVRKLHTGHIKISYLVVGYIEGVLKRFANYLNIQNYTEEITVYLVKTVSVLY